jgi:hypothetical protein
MNAKNAARVYRVEGRGGGSVKHLALSGKGAALAFLAHFDLDDPTGETTVLRVVDEGPLGKDTDRGAICFSPVCFLAAFSAGGGGEEDPRDE